MTLFQIMSVQIDLGQHFFPVYIIWINWGSWREYILPPWCFLSHCLLICLYALLLGMKTCGLLWRLSWFYWYEILALWVDSSVAIIQKFEPILNKKWVFKCLKKRNIVWVECFQDFLAVTVVPAARKKNFQNLAKLMKSNLVDAMCFSVLSLLTRNFSFKDAWKSHENITCSEHPTPTRCKGVIIIKRCISVPCRNKKLQWSTAEHISKFYILH